MLRCTLRATVGIAVVIALGFALVADRDSFAQAVVSKANNTTNLDQPGSWVGGVVPGAADVAAWNSTVASANATALGSNQAWRGIQFTNPGGAATISAGNVLTLGASGIDMSLATQDLGIAAGLTLAGDTKQTWNVAAGRTLTISGALTASAGAAVEFETGAGAGIVAIPSAAPSSILRYGVYNLAGGGADVAAIDGSGNVTTVAAVNVYNPNPVTAPNPNISGAQNGIDVVNLNATGTNAFRLSNNTTINAFGVSGSTGVVRFNTAHTADNVTFTNWTVDLSSRNFTWSDNNPVFLMTAATGGSSVLFNGTGQIRANGTGAFWVHQDNPNADLIFNQTTGFTQSGGAQQFHKDGAGRVIMANNGSNYTGATRIVEGSLQIGAGGNVGNLNAASNVINNAQLRFSRNDSYTFGNAISGTGSVVVANVGAGDVTLSGANTYTGSTTLAGGFVNLTALDDVGAAAAPLIFNGGGVKHSGALDISTKTTNFQAGGALIDTNGNSVTYAGAVGGGGAGGLTKLGTGVLTLAGANPYSGVSTVTAGTLNVTGSVAGGALVGADATLQGAGSIAGTTTVAAGGHLAPGVLVGTLTTGGLTLDAGSILDLEFGAGVNDRVVTTTTNGLTINGGLLNLFNQGVMTGFATPGTYNVLQFAGAVQGTGISALGVNNPEAGFAYAFGTSGNNVTVTITSTGTVANWVTNGGGSWNAAANWSTNPTIPNGVGASARFTTNLTSPASVTLDGGKTVGGVTFNSANGYTIAAGAGGNLTLANTGSSSAQLNAAQGSHTISAGAQLTSNVVAQIDSGATVTLSGAVSGAGGITMSEGGTLILTNAGNSYAGETALNAGAVQFAALGSLGSGNLSFSNGGALRYAAGNIADISSKTVTLGAGGGVIDTGGNNVTFANSIGNSGAGGLTKSGAGRLTMSVDNTYSGPTNVTGGTLSISANGQLGIPTSGAAVNLSNGATLESTAAAVIDFDADGLGANARMMALGTGGGVFDVTDVAGVVNVRGVVSGAGSLTKRGAGSLTLAGANNFAGGTVIQAGAVIMANGAALGTGPVTLQGAATLDQATFFVGNLAVSGTPTLRGGAGNGSQGLGTLTGSGTLNVAVSPGVFDFEGDMTGFNGTMNFTNNGGGTVRFNGSAGSANVGFNLTGVTINNRSGAGTLTLGSLTGDATAGLSGAGGGPTQLTTYVIGGRNESTEFMGLVSNNVGLTAITKVGAGTLTLSNLNTYTGNTRVEQGILSITQPYLSSAADVFVAGGATLNLNFDFSMTGAASVDSLYLNGISQLPGEYGAIGSGAQFVTPFITGTGRVNVITYDLPGDFDNNMVVNAADLTVWRDARVANNALGDTDGDGDSDGNDFLIWQRFLGATAPVTAASAAVPEPAMIALVALAVPVLVGAGRRGIARRPDGTKSRIRRGNDCSSAATF